MTLTASDQTTAPGMGRYTLITRLARGGMGNVYLAALCRPGGFNKLLALKELKPELAEDESYVAMFLEEARMAARLVHPNIVQTNEIISEDHRHFMTMEFLDGRSLARIVKRAAGAFPLGAHLRVLGDALLGLHYAHELRGFDGEPLDIVHRDVSPLNIMVTFDGQAKVLDFGVAKAADSSLETSAGVLKGRIAYMAPEQAAGAKVDRRADVFSIGVLLWEAASGRRLWSEMSDVEILHRLVGVGPPRLRDVAPDAPAALDAICARALAKDCEDRYATAAELLADLEAHLAQRDDTMSMRRIGELVSGMFADERRRMNQIVDGALTRTRTRSGVMPKFRASDHPERGSFPGEAGSLAEAMARAPEMSSAPPWGDAPSNGSMRCTPASKSEMKPSAGGTFAPSTQEAGARGGAGRRRLAIGLAGAALVVGLAAFASTLSPKGRGPAPAAGITAPIAPAAAPPAMSPPSAQTAPVIGAANTVASAPERGAAPESAATPARATKAEPHDAAKAPPAAPRGRAIAKPSLPTVTAPTAAAPGADAHSAAPAASCDPPFTVDADGIEHFKAGCL